LGPRDFAFERFAGQSFPFFILLGRQYAEGLFGGAGAQFLNFLLGRLAIAAGARLKRFAHLGLRTLLDVLELALLVRAQVERRSHFRIGQGDGAALLQADLLEALELIFLQDAGERCFVGFGDLREFGLSFFATQIAQPASR
jgi:hypothetical protein